MSPQRIATFIVIIAILAVIWFLLSPPRFWLNLTKAVEPTAAVGAQLVEKYECQSCHKIAGEGALKAPALDGVNLRSDDPVHVTLRLWLRDPSAVKGDTAMPNFRLSDSEIEAILAYLVENDLSQ
jgi:mono/diheme cytochrome c family protein